MTLTKEELGRSLVLFDTDPALARWITHVRFPTCGCVFESEEVESSDEVSWQLVGVPEAQRTFPTTLMDGDKIRWDFLTWIQETVAYVHKTGRVHRRRRDWLIDKWKERFL